MIKEYKMMKDIDRVDSVNYPPFQVDKSRFRVEGKTFRGDLNGTFALPEIVKYLECTA